MNKIPTEELIQLKEMLEKPLVDNFKFVIDNDELKICTSNSINMEKTLLNNILNELILYRQG